MENDIELMVSGYLAARLLVIAAVGYGVYRLLRHTPATVRIQAKNDPARQRILASRGKR